MKNKNALLNVGLIGLAIHLVLNVLGIFVFHKAAAVFFSEQWWTSWFPSLGAWLAVTMTGLGLHLRAKRKV